MEGEEIGIIWLAQCQQLLDPGVVLAASGSQPPSHLGPSGRHNKRVMCGGPTAPLVASPLPVHCNVTTLAVTLPLQGGA